MVSVDTDPPEVYEIRREASRDSLPTLLGFAAEVSARAGFDEETSLALRLAIEEACVNIIEHGYPGEAPGPISISIRPEASRVVVEIVDRAARFDPRQVPAPAIDAEADRRPIGGLGWYLIGQVMDEVRHLPEPGGGNRLTLIRALRR